MSRLYPELQIDLQKIYQNSLEAVRRCAESGIRVCGVIKGCSGLPEIARTISRAGVSQLGTSRIEEAVRCREAGISTPFLLLRVAGMSEIPDVVRYFDYSLQSELASVLRIDRECSVRGMHHKVIMMADLGDIREGYWYKEAFIRDCLFIDRQLDGAMLAGIGTNLGCYGAIRPTREKMEELTALADEICRQAGHPLEIISGGASNAYPLVHYHTMPQGINHLRIGDNILLSRGLQTKLNYRDMDYLDMTAFLVRAEVVEVKEKPSYPQGEFALNAYGKLPEFEDRGIRKRALIALGEADVGDVAELLPLNSRIRIIGGSSDYMILDVTECGRDLQPGDLIDFYPEYINMLHLTASGNVRKTFLNEP